MRCCVRKDLELVGVASVKLVVPERWEGGGGVKELVLRRDILTVLALFLCCALVIALVPDAHSDGCICSWGFDRAPPRPEPVPPRRSGGLGC